MNDGVLTSHPVVIHVGSGVCWVDKEVTADHP